MSKKQLIILISVLLLICLCITGAVVGGVAYFGKNVGDSLKNGADPARVKEVADLIANFDTPVGYKAVAMDLLIYKMLIFTPEADDVVGKPLIMLMQFSQNSGLSQEEMVEQMQRSFSQQSGQGTTQMRVVEEKTVNIRGEDVPATILESEGDGSLKMRQFIAIFEGNNGIVALMVQGSVSGWDEELVEDFISSIR